jgi:copper transport protein
LAAVRLLRRLLAGALITVAPVSTASAHASLLSSSPADGSRVAAPPARVRMLFSEPIVPELSHVTIAGVRGGAMRLVVSGDPHEVRAMEAPISIHDPGGYRVTWHIISADGHPVSGSFVFFVGDSLAPVPPSEIDTHAHHDGQMQMSDVEPGIAGAALTPALLRGLALSALLALCGLLAFVAHEPAESARQLRICGWLSGIATGLLAVHLVVWLIHVSPTNALDADVVTGALGREVGLTELIRLVLAALCAWALLLARRTRIAFAFALAAVLAGGAIGHPAAIDPLIAIPSKALHLAGVAFWFGGLVWLATADLSREECVRVAGNVSGIALTSVIVVTVTGAIQSFLFIPSWTDVLTSAYGITVIAKIVGLAVLVAFGAHHRYRLLPRVFAGDLQCGFSGSVKREMFVMIAVVMLGGFLAYVPTPQMHSMDSHSTSLEGTR